MRATTKNAFLRGLRNGLPFVVVAAPFSMLFGVVATEAGLDILETVAFSVLVIAGAAQFTALQLMSEDASVLMVIATSLAVNLRMGMYSAALVPHLGAATLWQRATVAYFLFDQSYAASIAEYERRPEMTLGEKLAYFAGVAVPVGPPWFLFTLVGALVGESIPEALALDFALPITFLALLAPMLRTAAHVAAAVTSVVLALALGWLPAGVGLLIAAAGAMCVGAAVEVAGAHPVSFGTVEIWTIILVVSAGTYLIRFSFLGIIGSRRLPPLVLRLLRYTPVAVIPGMVAPLVLWPAATDGQTDPARLVAALVALAAGWWTGNLLAAISAGAVTLYAGFAIF